MRRSLFTVLSLLFALCSVVTHASDSPASGPAIFAVSDVYGILPDGSNLELKGGRFGELAACNTHWDGATKTIKIFAARNEEAAVQIVIPGQGRGFRGRMSDLTGPGTIPASRATFSALLWVKDAAGKLSPDLVLPLDGSVAGLTSFDVPVAIKGLPRAANSVGPMLLEVWVPSDAAPGLYKGTVTVLEGERELAKLNLELTVLAFTLPSTPAFAMDLLDYGMPSSPLGFRDVLNKKDGLGHPAAKISAPALAANWQVYKLAADNRCYVNVLPYHSQRGNPAWAPPIEGKGAGARVMSWAEWDEVFAPILDGKCNKFGAPPANFTLAFNANYPYLCEGEPAKQFDWRPFKKSIPAGPGQEPALKEFEETNAAIAAQYTRHFAEKGWTRTRFEIYHNQKPDEVKGSGQRNKLPWKMDEPTEAADYKGLHYMHEVARQAFAPARAKGLQFVERLDIGHWNCDKFLTPAGAAAACYKAKAYNTANADRYFKGTIDQWVIGLIHAEGAQHLLAGYRAPQTKLMVYGSAFDGALRQHSGISAGLGWRMARIGVVGYIVYKIGLDQGNPEGAKKDYILYSGRGLGFAGALCCRRLKLWRDAVNDFDTLEAAKRKDPAAAAALLEQMVKVGPSSSPDYRTQTKSRGYWTSNNVEDYLRAKLKLAEIITGARLGGGELEGFSDRYTPCGSADAIVGYD